MEYAQSQPKLKENFYTHKEHKTAVQEPERLMDNSNFAVSSLSRARLFLLKRLELTDKRD